MACDSGARVGAEVAVRFAIGCPTDDPTTLTFKDLGMCRSKSFDTAIDSIDVTADKSESSRRLFITSFKTDTISLDGVSYEEDIYNQKELRNHIKFGDPLGPTAGKPFVWVEITHPVYKQIERYPVIASNWSDTGTYDDAVQWSCEFSSAGAPTVTDVV